MIPRLDGWFDGLKLKHSLVRRLFPLPMDKLRKEIDAEVDLIRQEITQDDEIETYINKYLERTKKIDEIVAFINKTSHVDRNETRRITQSLVKAVDEKANLAYRIRTLYNQETEMFLRDRGFLNISWDPEFIKQHVHTHPSINTLKEQLKAILDELNRVLDSECNTTGAAHRVASGQFVQRNDLLQSLSTLTGSLAKERETLKQLLGVEQYLKTSILPLRDQMEKKHQEFIELKAFTKTFELQFENVKEREYSFSRATRHQENMVGFPTDKYFFELESVIKSAADHLQKLLSLAQQRPDFVERVPSIREAVSLCRERLPLLGQFHDAYAQLSSLSDTFRRLSIDPVRNRAQIVELWNTIKSERYQSLIERIPFFERMQLQTGGSVYHGVGLTTGEAIEASLVDVEKHRKTVTQYADAIITRLTKGILPSCSSKNYNCCPELPAVFFWPSIGNWEAFAYFELKCSVYPVFSGKGHRVGMDEHMVFTQSALPLFDATLIFYPSSRYITDDRSGHHEKVLEMKAVDAVIAAMYRQVGNSLPVQFKLVSENKMWTLQEYVKAKNLQMR
jgi:hypothetical protein